MNLKEIGKLFTCKFVGNGPLLIKKPRIFQSSIVDNGRDYVLHYVGMSNMHIFLIFLPLVYK
jgi:hypothetical protein